MEGYSDEWLAREFRAIIIDLNELANEMQVRGMSFELNLPNAGSFIVRSIYPKSFPIKIGFINKSLFKGEEE